MAPSLTAGHPHSQQGHPHSQQGLVRNIDNVQMSMCDKAEIGLMLHAQGTSANETAASKNEECPVKSQPDITVAHQEVSDQMLKCWEDPQNDMLFYQTFSKMYHPAVLGRLI